jgi:HTH-type transcriptional regulator/antitoxin HigA
MKSSTETIIGAMRILARDIQSQDGVANAAIAEAADRLEEQQKKIGELEARIKTYEMLPDLMPIDAVSYVMKSRGLKQKDIGEHMGGSTRVSEFLHGKRKLQAWQIRNLHAAYGIPLEILIKDED